MNKKGFIDFEFGTETFVAIGFGLLAGFIALFVMKSSGAGIVWKMVTFLVSAIAGFFASYVIFNN